MTRGRARYGFGTARRPVVLSVVLLATVVGCAANPSPAVVARPSLSPTPADNASATRPTTVAAVRPFADAVSGVAFDLPATWSIGPTSGTTKLRATDPTGSSVLTLDVPSLPFHIPGMIPLGLVVSGYVDDEKKQLAGVTASPPAAVSVTDAKARRSTLTGTDAAGRTVIDDAFLVVHGDAVFVLSVDSSPAARPAARAALEAAVASIRWTR